MRLLNLYEIQPLLAGAHGPCISLYLSRPKSDLGERIAATRMIQLLRQTESLLKPSLPFKEIRRFMRPLWSFRRDLFWKNHRALALFHSQKLSGYLPLSTEVPELTVVADSFHLKPILKRFQDEEQRLWVLSLSQKNVQLFRWANRRLELVASIMSENKETWSWRHFVNSPDKSRGHIASALRGASSNIPDLDSHRESVSRHFRKVDSAIQPHLSGESFPLIIAGVGYLHPIFSRISNYPYISEMGIEGNFEKPALQNKLAHRVSELAEILKRTQDQKALAEYESASLASQGIDEFSLVTKAAIAGQIRKLFVAEDRQLWGTLDEKRGTAVLHPMRMTPHDDVTDDLAELVLKKGGSVHVLPACKMPTLSPVAAILRWPYLKES